MDNNAYSMAELSKLTLTQLKDLASTLGIVVAQVTPTRTKLLQEIKECLINEDRWVNDDGIVEQLEVDEDINEVLHTNDQLKLQIELAKLQNMKEIELAKIELARAEMQQRVELARIESEGRGFNNRAQNVNREQSNIDLAKYQQYVPKFSSLDPEDFFLLLEKNARDFDFPKEKMALILRSALTEGREKDVVLSLNEQEGNDYELIKEKVLRVYEGRPEKYRREFRELRKNNQQTYSDFLRQKEKCLDRWLRSRRVNNSYEELKEAILFEEFLNCTRSDIKLHIADREVHKVCEAARLADDFVLVHPYPAKNFYDKPQQNKNNPEQFRNQRFNNDKRPRAENFNNIGNVNKPIDRPILGPHPKPVCAYCKKEGHTRANCWALNKKPDKPKQVFAATCVTIKEKNTVKPKPEVHYYKKEHDKSLNSRGKNKTSNAIKLKASGRTEKVGSKTFCKNSQKLDPVRSSKVVGEDNHHLSADGSHKPSKSAKAKKGFELVHSTNKGKNVSDHIISSIYQNSNLSPQINQLADESLKKKAKQTRESPLENNTLRDFKPFIHEGFVSMPGDESCKRRILVLRDTGASQSLLLEGILPLSSDTFTGNKVLVRGVEMGEISVPLHTIQLDTELISGTVVVGVQPALPIDGIALLIGNDLAGGKVIPSSLIKSTVLSSLGSVKAQDPKSSSDTRVGNVSTTHPTCAVTRGMKRRKQQKKKESREAQAEQTTSLKESGLGTNQFANLLSGTTSETTTNMSSRHQLIKEQEDDVEIARLREQAVTEPEAEKSAVCYYLKDSLLMRKWTPSDKQINEGWCETHQIVVPVRYRNDILRIAHDLPYAGHMGVSKTYRRVLPYFFWPGLHRDVVNYCRTCDTCQLIGKPNQKVPVAPLHPIPAFGEPFSEIIIDCVGPLPKTRSGHQYLLTIMCTSTRFPEAIPLRSITARKVTDALVEFFTRYGLPRSIQTDQGTNFTSTLFEQVIKSLGIEHRKSSAYHPESQGALERFHQTLKTMLRSYCAENEQEWNTGIPFVLFAAREAVQESLGYSPFELIFGHTVRGPLKMLQESWLNQSEETGLIDYVISFKTRLFSAYNIAKRHLQEAQGRMKTWFDKKARVRDFKPGEQVLVFLPIPGQPLRAKFVGPYSIDSKIGEVNYLINTPDRRKNKRVVHVNMLKKYNIRESEKQNCTVVAQMAPVIHLTGEKPELDENFVESRLKNSATLKNFKSKIDHLTDDQVSEIYHLLNDFPALLGDVPRRTHLTKHDIDVGSEKAIRQHPYRVNPQQLKIIREEVKYMLDNDMIENSDSEWASPVLLVPKPDGTLRFCTDYRKLNQIVRSDSYPLPRIDDLIDRVGDSNFVTKIDLLSAYFQIPLTPRAQDVSSFITPDGLYRFKVMPFGLKTAPAAFQKLINTITREVQNCSAYLDDIIVYSKNFTEHIKQLRDLFNRLDGANLTINLAKCQFGHATVEFLGHVVGGGKVKPIDAKVRAIIDVPIPQNQKQIRRFLGMAGFYRKFCENFSVIAAPLTDLLKKNSKYVWSEQCNLAFEKLKTVLSSAPVLVTPDFNKQFKIYVDACETGMGAILCQIGEDGLEHPICYHSQKFNKHEKVYSTVERELLGILISLKHFDFYLRGSAFPIIIYTDHNPLTFLTRVKQNQRLLRWQLFLQSYNLSIHHVKGVENVPADTLSRLYMPF